MQIMKESPRVFSLEEYKKAIKTPFFFPAVSTVKTNFSPLEYVDLLKKVRYPGYLVSAYDIFYTKEKEKKDLINKVSESTEQGIFTFLDSGNYESFWHNDSKWSMKNLESILSKITVDLCFSYDLFWNNKEKEYIRETITLIAKTAALQKSGTTVPIIHSTPDLIPKIIKRDFQGV